MLNRVTAEQFTCKCHQYKMAVHAALGDSPSLHSPEPSAGPSGVEFNFLYSPEVGETVEVLGDHEESKRPEKSEKSRKLEV